MEEDTERLTLNLKPKRKSLRRSSSILKTTGGPLLDIDPNQQDGCSVPIKKSRPSLSRRVSFAKLLEVKEFPRDSPRRWLDSPAQPEPVPDTRNDTAPLAVPATLEQDQQVQHVTHVAENQHRSSLIPILPSTSAAHTENAFAASYGQQQQWTQESMIDGNSLLKTLSEMLTPSSERVGLDCHTQNIPSLRYDSSDMKVDGMALLQALDGDKPVKQAAGNTMFSENRYTNQTETLKGLRERTPLMALNNQAADDVRFEELNDDLGEKTIVFSQGDDMQQTEVLPMGLDLNSGLCEGDWGGLSGPVDRQSLLQSLGGSDETDSPEVLFAKKFETTNTNRQTIIGEGKSSTLHQNFEGYNIAHQKEPTIVFQQGLGMEETGVINMPIDEQEGFPCTNTPDNGKVKFYLGSDSGELKDMPMYRPMEKSNAEQTIIYQDGADIEQTEVLDSKINRRSLTQPLINQSLMSRGSMETVRSLPHNPYRSMLLHSDGTEIEQTGVLTNTNTTRLMQKSVNQTLMDGATMEETAVIDSTINRRSITRPVNQTLIDGATMEETAVIDSTINRGSITRPVNQTLIDGATMEETAVIDRTINRQSITRPVNQTLIDGATMEETAVIDSTINRGSITRPVNQTLIDGATMEETAVIDSTINRQSITRPVNQTLIDGATMEETAVIDSTINRQSITRPVNQTLIDGATMEETAVIDSTINRGSITRPVNQTLIDGATMEETAVIDSTINRGSITRPVNQTLIDGATMEETAVIDSTINRRSITRPVNQTLIDGATMEETAFIDSTINRQSITRPVNQTLIDGATMEETAVIDSTINRRSITRPVNQTLIDGATMEETAVIDSTINRGSITRPVNQTLIDGATMEETAVIDSTINKRSITRPVNQTLIDGATMEETAVIDSTINRQSITRPVNQTLIDGATMEETAVIDSTINRGSITRPVNQTLIDGATMEETAVIGSTIKSQTLAQPLNRSLMSEVEMEHTERIESNITRSSFNISVKETACNVPEEVSENKTVVFQESGDLEETHATTCNINIFAKTSNPTPSKKRNTDLYVTKTNTKSSLLTSARLKRLSARLGGDTGRLSLGTDNFTNRLTGESEVDDNQTSAIPRNTIRLTATPRKGSEGTPGHSNDASIADLPTKVESEVGLQKAAEQVENKSQTMETEETCSDIKQTGEMADVGITEILPPLDLGMTDMLPPDDIITNSLHTSIRTDQSFLKKASCAPVERKDSSGSDSSQSSSLMSYSLTNNYSMTESMLENTRREVDGPLTVKKLCLLLDIPCFRWLEDKPFVVRNNRCSILPGEQVDPSDMRNVLGACAVQCPFYLVHSHVYTQAVRQADLKKSKTEELDVLFTQEESKPFMFKAVKQSSEQQRTKLREKVLACSKVSSQLGKAEWKKVCAQATVQYRETLKGQYSRLQDQASDINIALHQTNDLLTALDTAWTELERDETDLENTRFPTEEDIQQWKKAQQELSEKVAELQHLEEEESKLTSKRDSIQAELAILRDRDQQFVSSQRQDVQQVLEKLKSDDAEIKTDLKWMKRCLEWRPDRVETEVVSYLFYNDTLLLETTLDTSLHRRLQSATLTSSLQDHPPKSVGHLADKSEDIMSLMHRLIISSIKEQNILTKFIGTPLKELFKFLRAVSMVVCTGRCLAQEISRIELNNWVTIKKKGLTIEFWCDQAGRKIDVDFDLKLKYRDYCATPTVKVDIGNFRPEDVLKQMSAVPDVGFRYLERLCEAIDLSDVTVVPVLDHCT
ncbi:uncharacterized protein [Argopecten irradians]|uniref:uncharacterized protein n=1 Tax=Argopecten irradians TaxID=31199 RepID=UPI0037180380